MKKIALILAVAIVGAIVLPSCKKDYTCECTFDASNGGGTQTVDVAINHAKKKDAKNACDAMTSTYMMYTSVQCNLK